MERIILRVLDGPDGNPVRDLPVWIRGEEPGDPRSYYSIAYGRSTDNQGVLVGDVLRQSPTIQILIEARYVSQVSALRLEGNYGESETRLETGPPEVMAGNPTFIMTLTRTRNDMVDNEITVWIRPASISPTPPQTQSFDYFPVILLGLAGAGVLAIAVAASGSKKDEKVK